MSNATLTSPAVDRTLPDPNAEPTISVERAGDILGISRRQAYRLVHAEEIPSIPVGKRYVVPTAKFLAHYGLAPTPAAKPRTKAVKVSRTVTAA